MRSRIAGLALALALAGSMLLILLAEGCSTTSSPPATPGSTGQSTKPSGSLNIAGQFGTANIDPLLGDVASFRGISTAIFDSIVDFSTDDQFVGAIAERWEISADGKTHTFFIRKGVKFHDGSDLMGADVKFSIERMLRPECSQPTSAQWRAAVDGVDLKDDYTVAVRLKQPRFDLMPGIDSGMGAVMPKKYIEEKGEDYFRSNPIGSGPWKMIKYVPATRLELEAVDSHWRAVPKFQKVTLLNVKEEATRLAMLKTGELDVAPIKPEWVAQLESAGLKVFRSKPGLAGRYFLWPWYDVEHPTSSPLGDVRVRKSLQLAMNSKEMADNLFRGFGGPYALIAMMPAAYFNDPSQIKIDAYDPEGAKKLLADAGFASGFDTKLWDPGGGNELSLIIQALAGYYRKVGVNAQIVPIDVTTLRTKYRPKVLPEVWGTLFTYTAILPQQFGSFATYFHSKQGASGNINDPKLDQLIEQVPATLDQNLKKQYATQAAVLAKNAYTTLSVLELDALLAVDAKVGDVPRVEARSEGIDARIMELITHGK